MSTQEQLNYERIASAIGYLQENFKVQPDLDQIAEKINLSPFHFQRLFTEWAGVSPKKFLQYLSLAYAKDILRDQQLTLFDAAYETGLSGTGRLHDLFVNIEGMTPGEFKNGGENLSINYNFTTTPFGKLLIASTNKGICHMAFADEENKVFEELKQQFPQAKFNQQKDSLQESALHIFNQNWNEPNEIKLHLKGTAFQLKVWETLLKVPKGNFTTYGKIAQTIGNPNASRAVGSAIGDNPIAFLIPCHRVIQSTGNFGQYHWGQVRKSVILGWEAAQVNLITS
ncbi:methylated-DNA--[protein]-cysteine S-methyltransferase [Pedobacter sp. Hv1]|uniref:bifunctional helix-turn-helix domain-containing protein/methylated-DNA--[protein]-cysteine S-methyltransferase n=1 Tax=Pedobacter sp. Hv1 TaxID=1740090 RepID=UPI0006D8C76F|nr:methylated-DNA--[protein]-cysteine S-methyltransferase [Pedobacter sp. Hv1]KQC01113.1 cysteine methyltransferase [Pedobacter sp. Hv1]